MHKVRWIHFSDLHLGNDAAADTRLMRRNLPGYIAGLNVAFDYAFCSGDIKEWSADYSTAADYLKTLCCSASTPLERLFLVPGNHDVDLRVGGEDRNTKIAEITDWKTSYYEPSEGLIPATDLSLLQSGREGFTEFVKGFLGEDRARLYTKPHFVIKTTDFNILHVDSTLTYSHGQDRDYIIGTRLLMDALDECDPKLPTILLTHYSFDFLAQSEQDHVEKILSDFGVQLWFAGHEHSNLIRIQRDKFLECQCGNLALQKGARSCFLTGELDTDTGEGSIIVHAWYEGKNWEQYPFARIGAENNRSYTFCLRKTNTAAVCDVSPELANARDAFASLSAVGGLFFNVNVNPAILTDLEFNGKTYTNAGQPYPLKQIMDSLWAASVSKAELSPNALVLGDGGMGKSTTLYHECQELLNQRQLAVYVSLQACEGIQRSISDSILQCLYRAIDERARNKFARLTASRHPRPDLVLFVDGFNELSGAGTQRYVAEIKSLARLAGMQIIVSSRLDFLRDYGLSHFAMIQSCDLRDEQIQQLFKDRPEDWDNVLAQKNLHVLLKNPMMALLYASTCPVVEKNVDLDYLEWIVPIKNASDLLHDYYTAQAALLINRDEVDGNRIFNSVVAINRVLPCIAWKMEQRRNTLLPESEFETILQAAVEEVNATCFPKLPQKLRRIKRQFRVHTEKVDCDELYELAILEMVLLRTGNGNVSFAHQIFRDYLCAVYLHVCLIESISVERCWKQEQISKGVIQYLRNIGNEETWGREGAVSRMLQPYRRKEAKANDWFVQNVISCWLSAGDGERDLSGLDLRKVSLAEHLRQSFHGTININDAWISRETLVNERSHDRVVGIAFSHDNRTLGAVSKNGIVTITNLLTKSQRIVGELEPVVEGKIGFDMEDKLILVTERGAYCWPTFSYDQVDTGNADDVIILQSFGEEERARINALHKRLYDSNLEGTIQCVSENGRFYATGYESGAIRVWNVFTQECIANLSMSDGQIVAAAFSKDGSVAALSSGGRIVQIWDMKQERCSGIVFFDQRINKLRMPTGEGVLECYFPDGTYQKVHLETGETEKTRFPARKQFVSKSLMQRFDKDELSDVKSTDSGNAIVVTKNGKAFTWDESRKKLSPCPKHNTRVTATAICSSDDRFAASYSPERYAATRADGDRWKLLNGQRLVRVRIVKTGQCQLRIPTLGRKITKLQFFTSNRIILAGYAHNGDILLWELFNQMKQGREIGEWKTVEIAKKHETEPLECAFPANSKNYISVYTDGSILIRPFSDSNEKTVICTLPGIDAGVLRWNSLQCDKGLLKTLDRYPHILSPDNQ